MASPRSLYTYIVTRRQIPDSTIFLAHGGNKEKEEKPEQIQRLSAPVLRRISLLLGPG